MSKEKGYLKIVLLFLYYIIIGLSNRIYNINPFNYWYLLFPFGVYFTLLGVEGMSELNEKEKET